MHDDGGPEPAEPDARHTASQRLEPAVERTALMGADSADDPPRALRQESFRGVLAVVATTARRGFVPLLLCWLVPTVPAALLVAVAVLAVSGDQAALVNGASRVPVATLGVMGWGVVVGALLLSGYAALVACGASLRVAAGVLLGVPVSVRAALRRAARRCGLLAVLGLAYVLLATAAVAGAALVVALAGVLTGSAAGTWVVGAAAVALALAVPLWCWRLVAYVAAVRVLEGPRVSVWALARENKPGFLAAGVVVLGGAVLLGGALDALAPLWAWLGISGVGIVVVCVALWTLALGWWGVVGASVLAATVLRHRLARAAGGWCRPVDLGAVRAELATVRGTDPPRATRIVLVAAAVALLAYPALAWLNPTGAAVVAEYRLGDEERQAYAATDVAAAVGAPTADAAERALLSWNTPPAVAAVLDGDTVHVVTVGDSPVNEQLLQLQLRSCPSDDCVTPQPLDLATVPGFYVTAGDLDIAAAPDGTLVVSLVDNADGSLTLFSCRPADCADTDPTTVLAPQFIRWETFREGSVYPPPLQPHMGAEVEVRPDGRPVLVYRSFRDGSATLLDCRDERCTAFDERPLTGPDEWQQTPALAVDSAGRPRLATYDRDRDAVILLSCRDTECGGIHTVELTARGVGRTTVDLRLDDADRPQVLWERTSQDVPIGTDHTVTRGLLLCGHPGCGG